MKHTVPQKPEVCFRRLRREQVQARPRCPPILDSFACVPAVQCWIKSLKSNILSICVRCLTGASLLPAGYAPVGIDDSSVMSNCNAWPQKSLIPT
jgi:hypothetical protein